MVREEIRRHRGGPKESSTLRAVLQATLKRFKKTGEKNNRRDHGGSSLHEMEQGGAALKRFLMLLEEISPSHEVY